MQNTPRLEHFTPREFACPCCGRVEMDAEFLRMLDRARGLAGLPFVIGSGFRCAERNRGAGGLANSAHLRGRAADIVCLASADRLRMLDALRAAGFARLGLAREFIHVDNDPRLPPGVLWLY